VPGEVPIHNVAVGSVYLGAPRADCQHLLVRLCDWLNEFPDHLWPESKHPTTIPMAILKAILAHLYIAWIHPFGDGNGRTARLIEFLLLAAAGVPSPAAHLLSNHYNETRTEYYRHLDRASKSGGNIFPFIHYAVQGMVDGLNTQLNRVHREHMRVAWESFVYNEFRSSKRSAAMFRQRDLVLSLTNAKEPVSKEMLRDLTPQLVRQYANKTLKTVSRDINALVGRKLIRKERSGYIANTSLMLGFKPLRRGNAADHV